MADVMFREVLTCLRNITTRGFLESTRLSSMTVHFYLNISHSYLYQFVDNGILDFEQLVSIRLRCRETARAGDCDRMKLVLIVGMYLLARM